MQNQPTDAGSSLQQQQTGLQQNAPSLQPNGSPATAPESTDFLHNYRSTQALTVQNQGEPLSPGNIQDSSNQPMVSFPVLALIIVPIAVAIALFWPNRKKKIPKEPVEAVVAKPVVTKPKSKVQKGKKKPTKRQRSAKR